ncbi:MAG: EF-hand domain-containing protein [Pseudomonadota bacterium]
MTQEPERGSPNWRKKSEMLEVRMSHPQKLALLEHCKANDMPASALVRTLIDDHLAGRTAPQQRRHTTLTQRIETMTVTVRHHSRLVAGSALAMAGALIMGVTTPSVASDGRAAFQQMDANQDSAISRNEFVDSVTEHQSAMTVRHEGEIHTIPRRRLIGAAHAEFERYDRNQDGYIVFDEFSGRYQARLRESFVYLDQDGDRQLSVAELSASLGGADLTLSRELMSELDRDNDQQLTFAEFSAEDV